LKLRRFPTRKLCCWEDFQPIMIKRPLFQFKNISPSSSSVFYTILIIKKNCSPGFENVINLQPDNKHVS
jgi:hypothetical protein